MFTLSMPLDGRPKMEVWASPIMYKYASKPMNKCIAGVWEALEIARHQVKDELLQESNSELKTMQLEHEKTQAKLAVTQRDAAKLQRHLDSARHDRVEEGEGLGVDSSDRGE